MKLKRRLRRRRQQPLWRRKLYMTAGVLLLLPLSRAQAASMDTLHDVPAAFQEIENEQTRIANYHAAEDNVRSTAAALETSHGYLVHAVDDLKRGEEYHAQAEKNLQANQKALQNTIETLPQARQASSEATQAALAAQQATADYVPQMQSQQDSIDSLYADREQVQSDYDSLPGDMAVPAAAPADDDRAERIREAWEAADYRWEALPAIEAEIGQDPDTPDVDVAGIEQYNANLAQRRSELTGRLDEIDAELQREESFYGEMEDYFAELQEAQAAAEQHEAEVRQWVRELEQAEIDQQAAVEQSKKDVATTAAQVVQLRENLSAVQKSYAQAQQNAAAARYALAHFGEGQSTQTGFEGYWWGSKKHQYVLSQSWYLSGKDWHVGVSAGSVSSDNGSLHGSHAGLTDTALSLRREYPHKKFSTAYTMDINLPTGSESAQESWLPDDLARYTSFGAGWDFMPGYEITRHYGERDSLRLRMAYDVRGSYDYFAYQAGDRRTYRTHPGDIFLQELRYLHAGEQGGSLLQFLHQTTGVSYQQEGARYRDGEEWSLRYFYRHHLSAADEWLGYAGLRYLQKTDYETQVQGPNDNVTRGSVGLGWVHHIDNKQKYGLMLNYMRSNGAFYDPLRQESGGFGQDRRKFAISAGYDLQMPDSNQLQLRVERYRLKSDGIDYNGKHAPGSIYRGLGMTLFFSHSF